MSDQPSEPAPRDPSTPPADVPPASPGAAERPATIDVETFRQIDLRVAEIVAVERVERADRLLRLQIDLGTERRQLVAGIAGLVAPDQLVGRKIIVVANLEPARIRGVESQGMLLAAGGRGPGAAFSLLGVDPAIPNGTRVE